MKLLLDLGNTRLKWAAWDGGLGPVTAHAHDAGGPEGFAALWKDIPTPEAIWVASVADPALDAALAQALRARFDRAPHFVVTPAAACGVRCAYAQPERFGVDRFLALVAAHAEVRGAAVVASCGTALTLDALAADGRHLGGLIAPSPERMRAALHGAAARLGAPADGRVVEFADNTADAIASGTWLAAAALTERFVARAARRLGTAPALLVGGGGAARLAALLELPHRVDADLVLRGLARYAEAAAHA